MSSGNKTRGRILKAINSSSLSGTGLCRFIKAADRIASRIVLFGAFAFLFAGVLIWLSAPSDIFWTIVVSVMIRPDSNLASSYIAYNYMTAALLAAGVLADIVGRRPFSVAVVAIGAILFFFAPRFESTSFLIWSLYLGLLPFVLFGTICLNLVRVCRQHPRACGVLAIAALASAITLPNIAMKLAIAHAAREIAGPNYCLQQYRRTPGPIITHGVFDLSFGLFISGRTARVYLVLPDDLYVWRFRQFAFEKTEFLEAFGFPTADDRAACARLNLLAERARAGRNFH